MPLASNPLDEVLASFYYSRDALTVTDRLLDSSTYFPDRSELANGTTYEQSSRDTSTEAILRCFELWEDHIVLTLWAKFELILIDFVSRRFPYSPLPNDTSALETAVVKTHDKFLERGSTDERLLMFKNIIDKTLLNNAHAIKEYRHWVAHQNPNRPRPQKVDPETAFLYLTYFLEQIEQFD